MNTTEWLGRLIAHDTTSHLSNLVLIDDVANYLDAHGLHPWLVKNEDYSKANLFVTLPAADGNTEGGLILSGHTDVVPAVPEGWCSHPFRADIREGKIYGRGAADMKGFIASVLAAVPKIQRTPLARPLHIALSYDEEVGCLGVPHMLDEIRARGLKPEYCIVGEPTSMRAVLAHKGIHLFRCRLHGKPAHSSLPHFGVNAVEYAARLILFIQNLAASFKQPPFADDSFNVPYSSLSINNIRGGMADNIVPPLCELRFDYRNLPQMSVLDVIDPLSHYIRHELEPQMQRTDPDALIEIEELVSVPAMPASDDTRLGALLNLLEMPTGAERVSYTTEGGLFRQAGIPTVICGPGSIEQAHRPNEYIELSQLAQCDAFLERVLKAFAK
ncbi:MAG: acetylornithine deacetylase [Neisseria sp.]|uniref:acetylornithine deacetylase n=1 Tax=Neisseria sp. TaxID=192066 RepID=UPI0026DAE4F6|nr:acetylornithine deacetylase [Neisseria sp.]MDO4641944.1 acetylornithine deacetylase [Neisseria sp.]